MNSKNPFKQNFVALKNRRKIFQPVLVEFGIISYLWETVLKPIWSFFAKQRTVETGIQGLNKIIDILRIDDSPLYELRQVTIKFYLQKVDSV